MTRNVDLFRLLLASWRRLVLYLLLGWLLFSLVLTLALVDLGCRECPAAAVDHFVGLKVLLLALTYAMAPVGILVVNIHQDLEILIGLPLTRKEINRFLLMQGGFLICCCLPVWALVWWQLPTFGIPVRHWFLVFTGLALFLYLMSGLVFNVFWRAAVPSAFVLLFFPPHSHETFRGFLNAAATPWLSLILFLVILATLPWVLARPLPLNTKGGL